MRTLLRRVSGSMHVADEQHLSGEDLVRVGGEGDVDGLTGEDERDVLLRHIGRDPDRFQVRDGHHGGSRVVEERAGSHLQIDHAAGYRRLQGQQPGLLLLIGRNAHRAQPRLDRSSSETACA